MNATQEELVEAEGIGPERAEALAEWFRDDDNRRLVEELRELGLRFEIGDEDRPVEGPLTGRTYVITGTLERFTREEAAARLEALGAKVGELRLVEDDRPRRRRGARQVEADEGREDRRAAAQRGRPARATGRRLAPSRTGPARGAPTTTRWASRSAGSRTRSGRPRNRRAPTRCRSSPSSRERHRSRRRSACGRASVPVRPATGSDESSSRRTSTSFHIVVRSDASASGVIRSSSERPEPSTSRTPVSGTPA